MRYIKNGKIIMPDGEITGKALVFSSKIVDIIDEEQIGSYGFGEVYDAEGGIIAPGLIDLHIHGYMGEDSSDGIEKGLNDISTSITKNGVTAWLPTTMTVPIEQLEKTFDVVRKLMNSKGCGAQIVGVNAEGPFISPKYKGAQKEENIKNIDADFLIRNSDVIKLTTVAPETEGALEAIEKVKKNSNIVISIGDTSATFEQALAGIKAGISHATHLFNAMTPLNHREPGTVGACLASDVTCELIADTFHINPGLFSLIYKIKKDKLILITDCTRAGGLEDGEYDLGGQMLTKKGIECRLPDGTIAGSVLTLNKSIYNFKKHTGLKDYEVISLATAGPAKLIGDETRGSLEVGKRADVVIFDNDYNVLKTFVDGKEA
jgi:N-acetylglucosamine-6-phosphate deacetylase